MDICISLRFDPQLYKSAGFLHHKKIQKNGFELAAGTQYSHPTGLWSYPLHPYLAFG
jgi:hypothetical protein